LIPTDMPSFWLAWPVYIALVMIAFSAIGFIYLIVTHNRYH
jgi:hypothetical protein